MTSILSMLWHSENRYGLFSGLVIITSFFETVTNLFIEGTLVVGLVWYNVKGASYFKL
ncbi:Uncharacterised protein [Mycobacterium tuberculosis]|nr:Uncharacterised protein [Mycobacterium tuberculosis]